MQHDPRDSLIAELIDDIAQRAGAAAHELAVLPRERKDACLLDLADRLVARTPLLMMENRKDLEAASALELSAPMVERLTFTPERIESMAEGVRAVAALPDPVGEEIEQLKPIKGFDLRKVRVPIGVIGIIYESRPNVTVDCAILCLKSGNASILRGGKEAFHTNQCLASLVRESLSEHGISEDAVQLIPTTDRQALTALLKQDEHVHCIIPRGGESLIRFVVENSNIPVIKHYTGVCSVYLDAAADPEMAKAITINAKCQRPSVCNAAENLIVHRDFAAEHLIPIAEALVAEGVELRVDGNTAKRLSSAGIATALAEEADWSTEYNDKILAVREVASTHEAVAFINRFGSGHSDAIVTADPAAAATFLNGVDASTVYHNVSTRFTDGFEFGLGAEIGISTDRLHARGPMGLRELCTYKFVARGNGEIRS